MCASPGGRRDAYCRAKAASWPSTVCTTRMSSATAGCPVIAPPAEARAAYKDALAKLPEQGNYRLVVQAKLDALGGAN